MGIYMLRAFGRLVAKKLVAKKWTNLSLYAIFHPQNAEFIVLVF